MNKILFPFFRYTFSSYLNQFFYFKQSAIL